MGNGCCNQWKEIRITGTIIQHVTWKRYELTETTSAINASDTAIKNDDLVWNKGAWLTLLASIEEAKVFGSTDLYLVSADFRRLEFFEMCSQF